jgi:hypothetical protein
MGNNRNQIFDNQHNVQLITQKNHSYCETRSNRELYKANMHGYEIASCPAMTIPL